MEKYIENEGQHVLELHQDCNTERGYIFSITTDGSIHPFRWPQRRRYHAGQAQELQLGTPSKVRHQEDEDREAQAHNIQDHFATIWTFAM